MKDGVVRVAPSIKFREIDDITEFSIAGTKYKCVLIDEGFSDVED